MRAALAAGVPVTVLPGPSAVETALVASGLVAERYAFVGFLPRRAGGAGGAVGGARAVGVAGRRVRVAADGSPRRCASLAAALPEREVAVCRELTKRFEEVVRGPAAEVAARFAEAPKGEITLVVGPGARTGPSRGASPRPRRAVADLVAAGTPRKVGRRGRVAPDRRVARNDLYRAIFVTRL